MLNKKEKNMQKNIRKQTSAFKPKNRKLIKKT